jgi:acyl-coenzyme A synthetase/AMP-(fatty) acid ligase
MLEDAFRLIITAGEAISARLQRRIDSELSVQVRQLYGMSEFGTLCFDLTGLPGSVGSPLAGVDIRAGSEGVPSVVHVRVRGWRGRYAAGSPQLGPDGFLNTGDIGLFDGTGALVLSGREALSLNLQGSKISPDEIEEIACSRDGVAECGVTIVRRGSSDTPTLVALIVVDDDLDPQSVRTFLAASLSPPKLPGVVLQVDALPRTHSGKIDRRRLVASAEAAIARETVR